MKMKAVSDATGLSVETLLSLPDSILDEFREWTQALNEVKNADFNPS